MQPIVEMRIIIEMSGSVIFYKECICKDIYIFFIQFLVVT